MSVTGNDLLALGLPEGPHFAAALAEANRLHLTGAALETFVRALLPAAEPAPAQPSAHRGA
jgi:hypothetical protein